MNNNNSGSNRSNIIPHDSSLRGYSVENSFYDSPYNMDFEYGYLNLMFNITAFTARTQDIFQNLESNLYSIIELQNERRRLEFESSQTRETRETRENNQNSNIPQSATQSSTSQESRQNIFTSHPTSSTTNPTSLNDNLNIFGTRNVFLGLNPMTLYSTGATTGSNASRVFRRNRSGLTIEEIEENTEIINYNSIDAEQILNTECPISRDVFNANSVVLRLKECQHCFVPFRMMTWLESHSTCPLCRCNVIPATTAAPTAAPTATTTATANAPPAPAPASATTPATTFSNIISNIRNNTNLDNLSIDNMNDDSLVFSFDLPRPVNGDTEGREFTNTYLSSLSQIFSNFNRNTTNTTNTTNQTTEPNNSVENNNTPSEHEYEEVD